MSRTKGSPELTRRPLHGSSRARRASPRNVHHTPYKSSDEDLQVESVDEISDSLDVGDNGTEHKGGLYPDIDEMEKEDASYVIFRTDKSGVVVAGQYTKTSVKTKYQTGSDSADSLPTKSGSFPVMKILCFIVLMLTVVVLVLYCCISTGMEPVKSTPHQVTEIVKELRKEYVNQPSLSFRIIKKALENVLMVKNMSEPTAPAVLLLMSTKGAEDETALFAEQLAKLVASGNRNYQTIYGDQLQREDPDKAKKEIDNLIKEAPKYNKQIVVLIRDLDVIPSKAVMMLHAYCDHENAPFKNAVFIMTISTDADLSDCEGRSFDEAAESHLTKAWGDLSKDMLGALLSRITVSVAAIYHRSKPTICR